MDWISTKDKLPPKDEWVTASVCDEHGNKWIEVLSLSGSSTWWGRGKDNFWNTEDITHWMELPQLPK